jgi:hypothetical protein
VNMFPSLPEELNELVLSTLGADHDSTLAAVACTNQAGRRIATPLLYQKVGHSGRQLQPQALSQLRSRKLRLLCRTLAENPALAAHVQETQLRLDRGGMRQEPGPDGCPVEIALTPESCQTLLMSRQPIECHVWEPLMMLRLSYQYPPTDEVYVILLLLLCHRAHTLHIHASADVINGMQLWHQILFERTCFEEIHTVHLNFTDKQDELDPDGRGQIDSMEVLLSLPDVQKLRTTGVYHGEVKRHGGPDEHGLFGPSTVEELEIVCGRLCLLAVTGILSRSCPDLKRLRFQLGGATYPLVQQNFFFINALARNVPELEHLSIEPQSLPTSEGFAGDSSGAPDSEPDSEAPHTLSDLGGLWGPCLSWNKLENLKTAVLPSLALFGQAERGETQDDVEALGTAEVALPPSLQKLTGESIMAQQRTNVHQRR